MNTTHNNLPAYVIGGGLGGLSAALHLSFLGRRAIVLEKNPAPGGKCNQRKIDGFTFDTGPSVLTLPFLIDEIFRLAGEQREDSLAIESVEPGCRYFFADDSRFDAPANLDDFTRALAETFPSEVEGWKKFSAYTRKLWDISGPAFLFHPLTWRLITRLDWKKLPGGLAALKPSTMKKEINRCFQDPRLRQLFARFATYNGSDPARCPATFNVISHVELAFGSWRCRGGMYALVEALASLARRRGIEIRCDQSVDAVEFDAFGKRVTGVRLADGEVLSTDSVVVNQDAVAALTGPLLREHPAALRWKKRWNRGEPSVSGYVILANWDRTFPELDCHNVIFPANYDQEFRQIFTKPQPLTEPTIYISIPARKEPGMAPPGKEGWFILVNAPSLRGVSEFPTDYPETVWKILEARGIIAPGERPSHLETLTPRHFADRYGAWEGTLYGHSSNHPLSAFLRVKQNSGVKGLSFAGGSAHPGGGIPLVLLSGRMAAEAITGKSLPNPDFSRSSGVMRE